jgi:hypothetical protein
VASEAGVIGFGYKVRIVGFFEEAIERVIEGRNEEMIDQVGGQSCSRSVLVPAVGQ